MATKRKSSRKSRKKSRKSPRKSRKSSSRKSSGKKIMAYNVRSKRKEEILSPKLKTYRRGKRTTYMVQGKSKNGDKLSVIVSKENAQKLR